MTTVNKKLFHQIATQMLLKPEQVEMLTWFHQVGKDIYDKHYKVSFMDATNGHNPVNHCGTSGCIAGWAMAIKSKEARELWDNCNGFDSIFDYQEAIVARELLGLTESQARSLFFPMYWENEYYDRLESANTSLAKVEVIIEYMGFCMENAEFENSSNNLSSPKTFEL